MTTHLRVLQHIQDTQTYERNGQRLEAYKKIQEAIRGAVRDINLALDYIEARYLGVI